MFAQDSPKQGFAWWCHIVTPPAPSCILSPPLRMVFDWEADDTAVDVGTQAGLGCIFSLRRGCMVIGIEGKLCIAGTVRLLPSLPQFADAPATYQATCRMVLIIATDEVEVDADMYTSEECKADAS